MLENNSSLALLISFNFFNYVIFWPAPHQEVLAVMHLQ